MSEEVLLTNKETTTVAQAINKLYPKLGTDLNHESNFQLLCAVLLSAQTTDVSVNKVTPQLFEKFPTPEAMSVASLEDIQENIRSIGLYKNKAKYLKNMSQMLLEKFEGQIPDNREELTTLPGVGRKTANVVLTNGFNIPAFAVDTHIKRVTRKLHFVPQDASVEKVEQMMSDKLPEDMWYPAHHSIWLFGRYQCIARKHDHSECIERIKENMPENEIAASALEKMITEIEG
ncbi:endonuclease III [Tetragenococcus halophilus]|uniref:endonuclease III n=1 Tax=Tetragenococcus halophilus TaxID=51669 RepID=UPI000CB486F8|nr:endonuclease III [Tetragenococcus halophilus]RQD32516.1 endonuclease III [Tetragenococcus halophilus subsp. halophilus DSM 20339]GBD59242.1 putative endonuclease III [Tetragenococcus halophilus subsp. halophilus]GMA43099.1 endonuclease III [Tetragenococcus halophilus subsp. halophilus DSM 20339]